MSDLFCFPFPESNNLQKLKKIGYGCEVSVSTQLTFQNHVE